MSDLNRLKIKTNIVIRTMKDTASYKKEVTEQKAKIETMKNSNAEEHDIKQMEQCLEESVQMISDCQIRLERAVADLEAQIATIPSTDTESIESEIYKNAQKAHEDGTALLATFEQK